MSLSLFRRWPALEDALPRKTLTQLPSPVEPANDLGRALSGSSIFIKRDDICAEAYAGNKVRKLEFLLADALSTGSQSILTFGAAGSNHALASSLYARRLGLGCKVILTPQAHTPWVQSTLLKHLELGTDLYPAADGAELSQILNDLRTGPEGADLYVIPFGGSSWIGTLGFVNAGLELADQVDRGDLPRPDRVYAACGTMGTVAGLALGLAAAGVSTRIVAVRVTPEVVANQKNYRRLYGETLKNLRALAPDFPASDDPEANLEWRDEQYGADYAVATDEAREAIGLARDKAQLSLETTYTAKALAALIEDSRQGRLKNQTVVFWNTFNSRPWSTDPDPDRWRELPTRLQEYFSDPAGSPST